MTISEPDLLAAATALARDAGQGIPVDLEALSGGKNNRVLRVLTDNGRSLLLKSYFADPRDPRDRLGAEWAFLSYAWNKGVRTIPQPLARDVDRKLGLYTFLPGRRLGVDEIDGGAVQAAADFIVSVNAGSDEGAIALAPGSEACFSIAQHVATVERRVGQLGNIDPAVPLSADAARLIADTLVPTWQDIRARIAAAAGADQDRILTAKEEIASPSDFGFHNALADGERIAFLDFEYAGRDDPAKLICDFFCQPEVPVALDHFEGFVATIQQGLGFGPALIERSRLLLDLYRIKWTCIILNAFQAVGAARRSFATAVPQPERCAQQLARAERKLAEIGRVPTTIGA